MTSPAQSPAPTRRIGGVEFIVLMALVQALQALGVDSMLPALGRIAADLSVASENQRQLVVGIYLLSSGLGCLIPGALADRFGRRPVLLVCLVTYVVCSASCGLVSSFQQLLVLRAILGFACAGLTVLPAAIIRDLHEGDRMARLQSTVAMVFMVVPMIAPSVGQAVLLFASWRWIFGVMALLGMVVAWWAGLRLPETLRPDYRQPIRLRTVVGGLVEVSTTRIAAGYVLGLSLIQGAMFGYINSSQQLVAEHFGAGARFPLIFAGMAFCMSATAFINSRIVERFGARRVSHCALLVYIGTAGLQLWTASRPHETLWEFVPMMAINMCLMGFVGSNFTSIALQPFARKAGAAASAQAFIRMVLASSLGAFVGQAFDGTARPLAMALLMAGVGCLGLVLFSERGQLFRRLLPPGTPRPIA
jgi:DHA1 family bicyclomycin/chloramphenicol resistance-like MFS transporter